MKVKIIEEFLSFLEVRKMKFDNSRKNALGRKQVNIGEFLDILIEIDQIILRTLNTFKEITLDEEGFDRFEENFKEKPDFKQLMIDYNYTEPFVKNPSNYYLTTVDSIKRENSYNNTTNLTLNELLSQPNEYIYHQFNCKENLYKPNSNYKKKMYVWNVLKKLHLNDQYKDYF